MRIARLDRSDGPDQEEGCVRQSLAAAHQQQWCSAGSDSIDPKPENETAANLRVAAGCGPLNESEGRIRNATERAQRRADRVRSAAGRSGQEGGRHLPGDGRIPTSLLQLEEALRRCWSKRVTRVAPATRGKPKAEDAGGGPHAGQAYSPGGAVKKSLKPAARRELVKSVREAYQLSEKRACGLMGITRWSNRYQSRKDSQAALRLRLRELAGSRVRYGYRRLTVLLRREGWAVNTKRVYRLYREEELQVRTAKRTKRARQARVALPGASRRISAGVWILSAIGLQTAGHGGQDHPEGGRRFSV